MEGKVEVFQCLVEVRMERKENGGSNFSLELCHAKWSNGEHQMKKVFGKSKNIYKRCLEP